MLHTYELWIVVQRNLPNERGGGFQTVDVAARYDTRIELAHPDRAHILALLLDMEYIEQTYEADGDTEIPIRCEKLINGDWRVECGVGCIELRHVAGTLGLARSL